MCPEHDHLKRFLPKLSRQVHRMLSLWLSAKGFQTVHVYNYTIKTIDHKWKVEYFIVKQFKNIFIIRIDRHQVCTYIKKINWDTIKHSLWKSIMHPRKAYNFYIFAISSINFIFPKCSEQFRTILNLFRNHL